MNEWLWYLSRATGISSILLMTAVVGLGAVTAARRRPTGQRATIVMALHRWLSLGMLLFLGTHIFTAVVETYVSIDWYAAVLPFSAAYDRVWVGFGTVAFDILVAVVATSLLRHRLRESTWRAVHLLAHLMWPVAIVHGVMMGTSAEPLLRGTTVACAVVGTGLLGWRLTATHADRERRTAVLAEEWS